MTIRATHFQRKEYLGPKEDHEMIIDIWDTPGQERYKTINQAYYRGAEGAIIVYSAVDDSNENIKRIKKMVKELRIYLPEDRPIMILANQYDMLQSLVNQNYTFMPDGNVHVNKAMEDVSNHSFIK